MYKKKPPSCLFFSPLYLSFVTKFIVVKLYYMAPCKTAYYLSYFITLFAIFQHVKIAEWPLNVFGKEDDQSVLNPPISLLRSNCGAFVVPPGAVNHKGRQLVHIYSPGVAFVYL